MNLRCWTQPLGPAFKLQTFRKFRFPFHILLRPVHVFRSTYHKSLSHFHRVLGSFRGSPLRRHGLLRSFHKLQPEFPVYRHRLSSFLLHIPRFLLRLHNISCFCPNRILGILKVSDRTSNVPSQISRALFHLYNLRLQKIISWLRQVLHRKCKTSR